MKKELKEYFDLCVVGAGPAGIILALEFAKNNQDKKVLLVEFGAKKQESTNKLDDSIEINNLVNHHTPYECTNKGVGGTSKTWGGRCVMYDEIDFIERAILNGNCTWDVALFNEIKKYTKETAKYFECGNDIFNLSEIEELKDIRITENFKEGVVTDSILERWSKPTQFGRRYYNEIESQTNITLLEGYEAREFGTPDANDMINTLVVRAYASEEALIIKAKSFVLAAGAQESTRVLLRNDAIFNNIGQIPDALGRYYQGHLSGKIASVRFNGSPDKTDYGFLRDKEGIYLRRRFQFSTKYLAEQNLLNTAIWLDNPLYYNPKHGSGAMSFMYLAMITPFLGKKLAPPAIAHSITKGEVFKVHKHLWNIVKQFPQSIITPAVIFFKRYCLSRKLPGVFLYSPENKYALHFHSEQIPNADNRMYLGDDKEVLKIDYKFQEKDVESVIKLHETLDEWLRKTGTGQLEYWYDKDKLFDKILEISKDGIHQVGTTRISQDSDSGVVDKNLRVWGTKNLYVCSSSVFPTSGQANPTFMLGAFALRLSKYISIQS